ncbi:MAG: 16S rRNA (cytosine(1402)-N(4))-methyltransferase RsmH [Nitrospinae bacterium]|nr:16S rRNA (cytosine(1402)-N(4))-methyltransferase RsmH [Nitrospinota bacterium]
MNSGSSSDEPGHAPVLRDEVIELIRPKPGGVYVDCTLGGAGHASAILEAAGSGATLIGLDRDPGAIERSGKRLARYGGGVELHNCRFEDLKVPLAGRLADGILIDLGVSSFMLDDAARGFSFQREGPLDMRMNPREGRTAADIVNAAGERELARIFREYGEERLAARIARMIVRRRAEKPFETTLDLAQVAVAAYPKGRQRIHPATRMFQALRIAVNGELEHLEQALLDAVSALKPGGRLAVISFHSLEDRIVKHTFARLARGCICPPKTPVCICGHKADAALLTRRPITAGEAETDKNPRARSAMLRAVQREAA